MKKTIFFLACIIIITALLFFSGSYLLDLAAFSETLGDGPGGLAQGDGGASGFPFLKFFKTNPSAELLEVLRSFGQGGADPVNILLLAGDEGINTDAIIVMRFDPATSRVNMLSIPRDTYITLKGYKFHKINSVFAVKNGAEQLKTLVSEMLGVNVDYYVRLNMKTVREVVDMLDGVEYEVPCDMKYDDPDQNLHINLKKGRQTLNGRQVEELLRFRKPNSWTKEVQKHYDGSDLKRIERQHDFFKEALRQKLNVKYLAKAGGIVDNVYSNVVTDLPLPEMLKLSRALPGLSSETFVTAMIPGGSKTIDGLSYFIHDEKQSRALAAEMLGG